MPELPTTPKGAATRRRILDAATEEFAERGIAGARVDRVIATARTNKAQLYGYFGSKDGLFDAVLADCMERSRTETPFDPADLAAWAVAVYDETLRNPALVRLLTWARLERRPAGLVVGNYDVEPKRKTVAEAQASGQVRDGDPFDLVIMVLAMATAWSPASSVYAATTDDPAVDHDRRRAFLRDCVNRAVAP